MDSQLLSVMCGQLLMVGFDGVLASAQIRNLIEQRSIGGVILFARNCKDGDQVQNLCERLQQTSKIGLFIGIDQEGGRVMRLRDDKYRLPAARELAAFTEEEIQTKAGFLAKRLREAGININFAPVLDVDSNPANPVIGDRSFATTAAGVSQAALAFAEGQRKAKVISCGKHFPGHGDTDTDSHLERPVVRHDRQRMDSVELPPFQDAIKAGIEMLMSAHVLYPALDEENIATCSPAILTELLRGELGFQGVMVSDDLEMKAIAGEYSPSELALKLVTAGVDLFLVCHSTDLAIDLHEALMSHVKAGRISEARLQQSVRRIMDLKRRFGIHDEPLA